ncbi:MAG: hypothetical protein NC236_01060 [Mycoplasma sp.]|nr:hypothetical protein [Mycoplasma sp.]
MIIKNNKLLVKVENNLISSIIFDKKEVLNKTKIWQKKFPILFPVIGISNGWLRNNEIIELKKHGYWNDIDFEISKISNENISLEGMLNNSIYPYSFDINQEILLNDNSIIISTKIKNTSNEKAFFQFGYHPAFNIDDSSKLNIKSSKVIETHLDGLIKETKMDSDISISSLEFPDVDTYSFFDSNKIKLINKDMIIDVEHNHKIISIWRKDKEKFICLEPWSNLPDIATKAKPDPNTKDLDYLEPNEYKTYEMKISFINN